MLSLERQRVMFAGEPNKVHGLKSFLRLVTEKSTETVTLSLFAPQLRHKYSTISQLAIDLQHAHIVKIGLL